MYKWLLSKPENTAVTLEEVKEQLRIEPAFTGHDNLLTGYIEAAIDHVENICGLKLISQGWVLNLYPEKDDSVYLPFGKAQSIESVNWKDKDGETEAIDPGDYELVHMNDNQSALRFVDGFSFASEGYHADPLSISFITGFGDNPDNVPAQIRLVLLLIVSHFYTTGLPVLNKDVESAVFVMLQNYRLWRL